MTGLARRVGQDCAQDMMARAFRPVREAEWAPMRGPPHGGPIQFDYDPRSILEIEADGLRRRGVPNSVLWAADYMRNHQPDRLQQWLREHRQYLSGIMEHWNG